MKAVTFLFIGLYFLSGCSVVGIQNVEEPSFALVTEENDFQIREYEELLIAQTVVAGNYKETSNEAFWRLANYIFGKNKKREEISMTAPVVQEPGNEEISMTAPVFQEKEGKQWMMYFVLPSKYTLENVPEPLDSKVKIKRIPKKIVGTITYSGFLTEANIKEKSKELQSWLDDKGYTSISSPRSAGYDPPWTIPFFRRNEVHIDVKPEAFSLQILPLSIEQKNSIIRGKAG